MRDGWFPTGDVATIDADGFMQITDRSKDVIKSGGEWISSIDLENTAMAHPAVKEAAVVGVMHPKWDERPLLIVVKKADAQLTRPMTLLQFRNVLAPVRAAIRDGAGIDAAANQGDETTAVVTSAKQFPLALTFESNRGFVLLNQGTDDRVRPGVEVLAINGQALEKIMQAMLPNLGQYGDVRTWPMYQLGISGGLFRPGVPGRNGFSEAYRLYIGNPASFRTTLRDPRTRQTVVVELAGVTRAEAAANANRNPVNRGVLAGLETLRGLSTAPSIRYLDGESTAVLVPSWGGNFPDFLKETFAALKSRGTKHLIIDVRGNTGGFDQYPALLFSIHIMETVRSNESP
jgi:hypothetical protein